VGSLGRKGLLELMGDGRRKAASTLGGGAREGEKVRSNNDRGEKKVSRTGESGGGATRLKKRKRMGHYNLLLRGTEWSCAQKRGVTKKRHT